MDWGMFVDFATDANILLRKIRKGSVFGRIHVVGARKLNLVIQGMGWVRLITQVPIISFLSFLKFVSKFFYTIHFY